MNKNYLFSCSSLKVNEVVNHKGSRSTITAFLLLSVFLLFLGCESSGSVGDGLTPDGETVENLTLDVEDLSTIDVNTFSGRLQNSSIGRVEDPLYGNINSVFLAKPSLTSSAIDTIIDSDQLSLRLIFNSSVYGDESSVSNFEIYEAGEIWRGAQLRHNQEIPINFSNKLGEFQLADEDTLVVPLSQSWTQKFAEHFNSEEADSDSLYLNNFPGLAIVPVGNNSKIRFLKNMEDSEEEQLLTSFLLNADQEQEVEEEENGPEVLNIRDWGSTVIRTDEPETESGFVLHNSERILKVDIDIPADELRSKNIVSVRLILSKDQFFEDSFPMPRPTAEMIRAHIFSSQPPDVIGDIFSKDPNFVATLDSDDEFFSLNLTQFALNEIFGEFEQGSIYISLQSVNGLLYSTKFIGNDGPDHRKPRLVITSVK